MADADSHHPTINIKFSLKGLKETYNVACPDPSVTWKEFVTSNCKIPFGDYVIQRTILNQSKKVEKLIFSGDEKVSDFLSSFRTNCRKHRVTVIKRPKSLQASTETARNVDDEQPSTSGANIRAKIKGNSPPLAKRGRGRPRKVINSLTPAPIKNEKARRNGLSASVELPTNVINQNPNIPIYNAIATNSASASSNIIYALQGPNGINGYNYNDNFPSGGNLDVDDNMSQDSQEDSSLVDIKAIIIQRWVKYFSNTDFHRMVNEHRNLQAGGSLKLCRLLPWTASCLRTVLEEPFNK